MTRRQSMRAQAQEIYREMAEEAASSQIATPSPLPNPPPQAGEGRVNAGGGEQQDLTARVRALYENSAVPVAEIARLAGVTERTLYKYAQKGGWKPRYAWIDRGGLAHRRWRAPAPFAPVKGAGARFVMREHKGKPFAHGLKATDTRGGSRAATACAVAEARGRQAQAEAAWLRWNEIFLSWLKTAVLLRDALAASRARRGKRLPAAPATDAHEQSLIRAGNIAIDSLQRCQAYSERCGFIETLPRALAV
jgi:hypothetical protein